MYRLIAVRVRNVVTNQTRERWRNRVRGRRAMKTKDTSVSPCSSRTTLGGAMFEYSPWNPGTGYVCPKRVRLS